MYYFPLIILKVMPYLVLFQFACTSNNSKGVVSVVRHDTTSLADTLIKPKGPDTLLYIQGKFEPKDHPMFESIPLSYASREGMYLRKEALQAFITMATAAGKEGLPFKIISATRNFDSQKKIWEDKWTGKTLVEDGKNLSKLNWTNEKKALKILEYSSMPGTSRHHWGTDMDINALDNNYFKSGQGKKWYDWMTKHAHEYGFCQPYTANRTHGYKEEKWHWTYLPVSRPLSEYYQRKLESNKIDGFLGSETASTISVIQHYVLGINPACK